MSYEKCPFYVTQDERKHLTTREVEQVIAATKGRRHEARDRCLLLLMFRHGLRVSEACGLKLSQVDIDSQLLHVKRMKNGISTTQPLHIDDVEACQEWLSARLLLIAHPDEQSFFLSQKGRQLSRGMAWHIVRQCGEAARLPLKIHPHKLRHACGYALADRGADTRLIQDYLGHRNIQNTVGYTATNPARFEKLWHD
jgi:type 1 fimbriae regulatory protein FimB